MTRVHIITGFLGTGKTTAILHLLKNKNPNEKWAVLVNEFGEIGIDGTILKQAGVAVREVPGGCLCCVSGLPFQIGLNFLLAREKPDVLIIEPTGLGHPKNILKTLLDENYREVLNLGATLCLVDPRYLSNSRYLENEVFIDQIQLADVLIANKTDLCSKADKQAFMQLLQQAKPAKAGSQWVEHGQISVDLLSMPFSPERMAIYPQAHATAAEPLRITLPLAAHEDFRRMENKGQGYFSLGWLLKPELIFSTVKVRDWFSSLDIERAKAVLHTDEGVRLFNLREGVLSESVLEELSESRLELIDSKPFLAQELENFMLGLLEPKA